MKTVLAIDDNTAHRALCREVLAEMDMAAVEVENGREALARAAEQQYDCILLDLKLPDASGLDLVPGLSAPPNEGSPIIVVTGHGTIESAVTANSIGPLAAVVHILQKGTVTMTVGIPFWILALGGIGIVLGPATYGHRVMHTVGSKITQLTPSRGVAADIAATVTVLVCTRMKLPVSTTHTLVGAILGVGLARGLGAVNRSVTRNIFGSWLITVPAAAVLAIVFFLLGKVFLLEMVKDTVGSAADNFLLHSPSETKPHDSSQYYPVEKSRLSGTIIQG